VSTPSQAGKAQKQPEPWLWLILTVLVVVASTATRLDRAPWFVSVAEVLILAVAYGMFLRAARSRRTGILRLRGADSEGSFVAETGRAILDLNILILLETALAASTSGVLLVPFGSLLTLAEILVLLFTAALVYLTAIYAATALSFHTDRSIRENLSAQVEASSAIVEAIRTLKDSTEVGSRLVASEVTALTGELKDAESRRQTRERELALEAETREREQREAVRPKLDAKLEIVGGPLHSVLLSVTNTGMDAFNLTIRVSGRLTPNPVIPVGRIGRDETKKFNLGDVGGFPKDQKTPVTVRCSAFDVAGRPLEFNWIFLYLRMTGTLGVTTGWEIQKSS